MKLAPICLAAALCGGALHAPALAQPQTAEDTPVSARVSVGPLDDGNWFVRYTFDAPQPVYALAHSLTGYRSATWTPQTDGVRFGRLDGIDVIIAEEPVSEIEFSIIPLTGQLPNDPTPFVTFAGGGIAIHDAQFELVGFKDMEAVEALEGDIAAASASVIPMEITVEADGPIRTSADTGQGTLSAPVKDQYIYLGDGEFEPHEGFSMLADPYLPGWLASSFPDAVEGFLTTLETNWGRELGEDVSLIVAYKGAQARGLSLDGNALSDQVMLELGGQGFAEANGDALAYLHWYTTRELVELFQTPGDVRLGGPETAWIHDGFANSIAYQLIASDMQSRDEFLSSVYTGAFEDCVATLEGGTLESAIERRAVTGPYACGDFIALASDGYLRQRDIFGIWQALTDWASRSSDKTIDKQVYFTAMQLLGAAPAQRERIRAIVEDELDKPRTALRELLEDAGLEPQFNESGQLRALDWPDYTVQ